MGCIGMQYVACLKEAENKIGQETDMSLKITGIVIDQLGGIEHDVF